jgi:membrane-associated phospholipid phosphatase
MATPSHTFIPSGHASLIFSSVGFLTFYLHSKLRLTSPSVKGQAWRLITTALPFLFCVCVALSRTCDYHHHWQDVTVGSLVGLFMAYACHSQYLPCEDSVRSVTQHLWKRSEMDVSQVEVGKFGVETMNMNSSAVFHGVSKRGPKIEI